MVGRISYADMSRSVKLDKKDEQILDILAANSRTPYTQVAKKIRLSRDAVDYRVKRLIKEGIILRQFANINYERLGYYLFHVFFLVDEVDEDEKKRFLSFLSNHPHVRNIIEYNDRWDFEIMLLARSLREFDDIILDITGHFPKVILEKDKVEIIKRYNTTYNPASQGNVKIFMTNEAPKLEPVDWKLLTLLSQDCTLSHYTYAKELGISSDTVRYKMKQYEEQGIINNYAVLLNLSLLGYEWYTFSIEMKTFSRKDEQKFEAFVRQNPCIMRSAKTLGGWDLLLYVVVKDPKEYHTIIKSIKHEFSAIIKNYQTWIAYQEHVYNTLPTVITK